MSVGAVRDAAILEAEDNDEGISPELRNGYLIRLILPSPRAPGLGLSIAARIGGEGSSTSCP
jgi:hypothetical protein